jgi:1-acyl-sn-glycerol-3-phosphate acyltransferase
MPLQHGDFQPEPALPDAIIRAMSATARRPGRLAVLAASTGAALFAVLGSLIFGMAAVLLGWIPPRGRIMLWLARWWARGLLLCSGVRLTAHHEAALDPRRSYVFLPNHQGNYDIPALLATVRAEVRFAAKKSLFPIPVFGWALAVGGFIPIDREDRSRARRAFAAAAARLKAGTSVLFFPEGTRSWDGRLGPFERGGFLLALRSGLPIVPVGIAGSHAVMPRVRLAVAPGRITVRYGAPIEVEPYGLRRKAELMEEVRRRIAELAGLAGEVAGGEKAAR